MLKSNSNQLTFENEIQNVRDQRKNQFRKPTYAEVTSENKQDKFPSPPPLPRIEDMRQQMNNESQIHQAAQNQQGTLPH